MSRQNRRTTWNTATWSFDTKRFRVTLTLSPEYGYRYDGDDEDGEVQRKLDSGEYVAFESAVRVYLDGREIAADYLGGSVYGADEVAQFYTAHRDSNPMNRNCSIMRGKHPAGPNVSVVHYFPDMVRIAVREARAELWRRQETFPHLRRTAQGVSPRVYSRVILPEWPARLLAGQLHQAPRRA